MNHQSGKAQKARRAKRPAAATGDATGVSASASMATTGRPEWVDNADSTWAKEHARHVEAEARLARSWMQARKSQNQDDLRAFVVAAKAAVGRQPRGLLADKLEQVARMSLMHLRKGSLRTGPKTGEVIKPTLSAGIIDRGRDHEIALLEAALALVETTSGENGEVVALWDLLEWEGEWEQAIKKAGPGAAAMMRLCFQLQSARHLIARPVRGSSTGDIRKTYEANRHLEEKQRVLAVMKEHKVRRATVYRRLSTTAGIKLSDR